WANSNCTWICFITKEKQYDAKICPFCYLFSYGCFNSCCWSHLGLYLSSPNWNIKSILEGIGLGSWTNSWLADPSINLYAVSIPIIWNYIGPYLIIFIAAIQNIPSEVEEAALLDGATGFKKLKYITLPMVWTTVKI